MIALLDDNDSEVVNHVKNQLIAQGMSIHELLQEAVLDCDSEIAIENLMEVIIELQGRDLISDFQRWLLTADKSLLEGAFLIAKTAFFDFEYKKYVASLDKFKKEVWMEINQHQTPFEHVSIINQILFIQNKFKVVDHLDEPDLFSLPYAIDARKGNIYSIGLLYAIISELLHFPIYPVDLEDHLILAYCRDFEENKILLQEDVLFYINPEKKGAIFSKNEIDAYIEKKHLSPEARFYQPASNIKIIKSILKVLSNFKSIGEGYQAKLILQLIDLIDQVES